MERRPDLRVPLIKTTLSDGVRNNFIYPKFVAVYTNKDEVYVVARDPFTLDWFAAGTVLYEPKTFPPFRFNKFFYYKGHPEAKVFYDTTYSGSGELTWGSYEVKIGDTDVTFED